ncbi:class I SAM-dependent methyltransferase [Rugamonas apoptosis]|uniref:S-adenosyl-L-methionine-dependent methyltransferase n=1 Tax=Rugamonas apoptosis TaxID=2758570 RepID=A0A7W2F870_9BURK|nr:class I SAM-dependent methyltransferase [Rugamonas apoptosis]MBA5686907.1 class I SAM-dependent methyltransferase [Rugamonas apoptosis]
MERILSSLASSDSILRLGLPSRSALLVATLRAAHQLLDHPPVFADPLALPILGPELEGQLRAQLPRYAHGPVRQLRGATAVRSRLAEEELAGAVACGVKQYVVLGAGLDTFAYRCHGLPLRVFEVDHPATQRWKREQLRHAGIAAPDSLTFVPFDFERDTLDAALAAAGCRLDLPVFLSWLGVTLYLSDDAVFDTLRVVAALPAGSAIVFDYGVVPELLDLFDRMGMAYFASKFEAAGEPWKSLFAPAVLLSELRALGFGAVSDYGADALRTHYLGGQSDGWHLGGAMRLVVAHTGTSVA